MTELRTYQQTVDYLYEGMPPSNDQAYRGEEGLARALHFFEQLGNPQDNYRSIHIAGTSGKGSVAHILSNLLAAHGQHVGTHTSPHFYNLRERFLIDGALLSEEAFIATVNSLLPEIEIMADSAYGPASFFEITNAIAFCAFSQRTVDYAVIETGLGGLLDSTNSITRADKLSIITKLGYDHTEVLGDTLDKIATQKAGIINEGSDVLALSPDVPEATAAITSTAQARNAHLELVDIATLTNNSARANAAGSKFNYRGQTLQLDDIQLGLSGLHQVENTVLALRALELLSVRDGFSLQPTAILQALATLTIPGRFEKQRLGENEVILDGAHNPQKIRALISTVSERYKDKVVATLAFKQDKDIEQIAKILAPHVSAVVASSYGVNPDDKLHAPVDPKEIQRVFEASGIRTVVEQGSPEQVLVAAQNLAGKNTPILVTGSIYFVGEIGAHLHSG